MENNEEEFNLEGGGRFYEWFRGLFRREEDPLPPIPSQQHAAPSQQHAARSPAAPPRTTAAPLPSVPPRTPATSAAAAAATPRPTVSRTPRPTVPRTPATPLPDNLKIEHNGRTYNTEKEYLTFLNLLITNKKLCSDSSGKKCETRRNILSTLINHYSNMINSEIYAFLKVEENYKKLFDNIVINYREKNKKLPLDDLDKAIIKFIVEINGGNYDFIREALCPMDNTPLLKENDPLLKEIEKEIKYPNAKEGATLFLEGCPPDKPVNVEPVYATVEKVEKPEVVYTTPEFALRNRAQVIGNKSETHYAEVRHSGGDRYYKKYLKYKQKYIQLNNQ